MQRVAAESIVFARQTFFHQRFVPVLAVNGERLVVMALEKQGMGKVPLDDGRRRSTISSKFDKWSLKTVIVARPASGDQSAIFSDTF